MLACALAACDRDRTELTAPAPPRAITQAAVQAADAGPTAQQLREHAEQLIADAFEKPAQPGAPGFDRQRTQMVARAKAEPVVFIRTPKPPENISKKAKGYRIALGRKYGIYNRLLAARDEFEATPKLGREVLLSEGYLYAERPNLAFSMVSLVGPQHLFSEKRIWVHRGDRLMHAERDRRGVYRYIDGPDQGGKVLLLHLDRIGTGTPPPPLHRDFRSLRYREHFEQAKVLHLTESEIVAELRYGDVWVETLLESDGARLKVAASLVDSDDAEKVAAVRAANKKRNAALQILRGAILAQIDERLPFDEPKTEEGQEDGKLRGIWLAAYLEGRNKYTYNGDDYQVFDPQGRPRVPQVCVDFLVDSYIRAGGSWWQERNQDRLKTEGLLSFDRLQRSELRRAKSFFSYAKEHEEWFDAITIPERKRIEIGHKERFFRYLTRNVDQFQAGDIIFIRGHTPWDETELHTHTFFIYETDPLTGVPIAIAGNPGPASIWSWETEARRTPLRSIQHRIRPKLPWYEKVIHPGSKPAPTPPVMVLGR